MKAYTGKPYRGDLNAANRHRAARARAIRRDEQTITILTVLGACLGMLCYGGLGVLVFICAVNWLT